MQCESTWKAKIGNRAVELLKELLEKAGIRTTNLIQLLLDICFLILDSDLNYTPSIVLDTVNLIFEDHATQAATALMKTHTANTQEKHVQWYIAERISAYIPDILLLRPNVLRVQDALRQLAQEGIDVLEPQALISELEKTFASIETAEVANLRNLRDSYRSVVDPTYITKLGSQYTKHSIQSIRSSDAHFIY